jgi:hypothetical protein
VWSTRSRSASAGEAINSVSAVMKCIVAQLSGSRRAAGRFAGAAT